MENKAHALAAGLFVAALAVLLLALAAWLTREGGPRDVYQISTRLTVTGLQPQAPVRYRGVEVGKVSAIGFDPQAQGNVLITMQINQDVPITRDTFATLSYQGVTGLAFVQLSDRGRQAARLQADEAGPPPRIPMEPGMLARLEERGEVILDQVEEVSIKLNRLLGDENQQRFSSALANLDRAAGRMGGLAQRLETTVDNSVDPALAEATQALKAVQGSARDVSAAASEFGQAARRLNAQGGPLDQVSDGAEALSQSVQSFNAATLPRLNSLAEDTSRTVRQLGRLANSLRENPQSLLYGEGPLRPGPGEPGFQPPGAPRRTR
jgi:phospholipid/cholesterol/gamma-HCH transport system substrate-binding protein